jgi:hypothetical protein
MCIHYLHHVSPPTLSPTTSPLPLVQTPDPPFRQNLFRPPVLQFCRRKNIKDNKRNMVFLLVGDKDSYKGRFLVLFPCICVLQPQLVHFNQSSSLLPTWSPSHGGLGQFKITVFVPIQWAHQPHSSFWFPSLALSLHAWPPLSVTRVQ